MSSLFVEAEEELAALALRSLDAKELDVVVGGLGLGYTAAEALENEAVRSLLVIETMVPVILVAPARTGAARGQACTGFALFPGARRFL